MNRLTRGVGVLAIAGIGLGPAAPRQAEPPAPGARELAASFGGVKHVTRPSRDATMGFAFPAELTDVLARGGTTVRLGDVLVRARDDEVLAQRDLQKLVADSDLEVKLNEALVAQAQVEHDAYATQETGSKIERDRARTALQRANVELDIARLNRDQAAIQLRLRQATLDRYTLRAPFDGRIDIVAADVGEVKREGDPVLRIVNTNPLWIDAPVPAALTLTLALKNGDPAWVLMDLPGDPRVFAGKVVELAAEVDPSSGTRRVRVEVPNPTDLPAGLTAWVRLTEPEGEWRGRLAAGPAARANRAGDGE